MNISYMAIPGVQRRNSGLILTKERKIKIIIDIVCDHYLITEIEMRSRVRKREIVDARHTIFYFIKTICGVGVAEIGNMFSRNHATIINAIEKVKDIAFSDDIFKNELLGLRRDVDRELVKHKIFLAKSKESLVS